MSLGPKTEAAQQAVSDRPAAPDDIDIRFAAHSVSVEEANRIAHIRWEFRRMAGVITGAVPAGRERSTALTHLEAAMFFAVAGIARS